MPQHHLNGLQFINLEPELSDWDGDCREDPANDESVEYDTETRLPHRAALKSVESTTNVGEFDSNIYRELEFWRHFFQKGID